MTSPHESLTLQLLEWVADKPRTWAELMDAWKTTCPRLSIWEDACADKLIGCGRGPDGVVFLTEEGRRRLLSQALLE